MGYLPAAKIKIAEKGYKGINEKFIKEENGQTNLYGTVKVSGLGGNPYRDGTFNYYMSEPVIVNDAKGVGACLLAATEMELIPTLSTGKGKSVVLDRYFNSEKRKDASGAMVYWHYIWEERSHPGFATWGKIFTNHGAQLKTLDEAPTVEKLKGADVYIIVDADHVKDNPTPNPITDQDSKAIASWVKQGGVLLLMANDSANCDLQGFNRLSKIFGVTLTDFSANMVKNDYYTTGAVIVEKANEVFQPVTMYLKEISLLDVKSPSKVLVKNGGDNVMSVCTYGKGKVLILGDPWIYNEYLDGRKLPAEYQNYKAASDLVKWLLK
jgi:unsaturated rhamnogalacturonyl hydrolase